MITAIIVASLASAPPVPAPELFGLTLGQPIRFAECPELREANGKPRKRTKYYRWIYGSARSVGAPCYQRFADQGTGAPFNSIERIQVSFPETLKIAGASGLYVMIIEGKVAAIDMPTNGAWSQDADLQTLTVKFGAPSKLQRDVMQNGYGANFTRINAYWDFGDGVEGQLFGFMSERTEGNFSLSTPTSRAENQRKLQSIKNFGRDL